MGLYEQIRDIAKSKGYSVNKLEKELGFARSSINKFNKNKPSVEKLQQIADLLDVSLDYLLSNADETVKEKAPELTARDERDIKKDLDSLREKLANKEFGPAAYDGQDIPEEDIDLFLGQVDLMLRRVKIKNKEKYNPNKNKK